MTKSIEIEGKTIDEAIETACQEFGVPRVKLNIEIISEGSAGLFGLGSKKAKIRASLLTLDVDLGFADDKPERPSGEQTVRTEEPRATTPTPAVHDSAVRAQKLLEGILQRMGVNARVTIQEAPDATLLVVEGNDNGLLIGKRGQTLDALQHLVNKAVNRQEKDRKQIVIDTEDYRRKREESLVALAEKLARKAKRTRKAVTLSNMNARERRIIHLALQGDESLTTKSRGEGSHRKIIIQPSRKK
ncbi:MAG TPA: RNA-binding cell elongation regulator Jag/EloR [Syntrophales bacterium]|nr:RNA-binding cell elongation regulator Jag/EloR [Syntrophales bacterium]HOX94428.1 RNA-binding cell elongation regulator Jag/EloR [Syntrophales bacterium]HPI56811.1 RNA-binding cell elongation regulator Jag/EloR [Syntrophales bacterium]HPN25751.1 RNA-binding cell elongation regulator Jag/EloR [Syntrophales bacterium]HQM28716.1 RNA-binding cell elongation regulator Jag/EloR [Syntrophales bacterium]